MSLRKLDSLLLSTTQGPCEIQLHLGDITKLSVEDKVDLILVSAFPCEFSLLVMSHLVSIIFPNRITVHFPTMRPGHESHHSRLIRK